MHKKISRTNFSSINSENDDLSFKDEAVFHRMIENIEDYAILLIDKNGIILNWNKGAEKIKGYQSPEIIGPLVGRNAITSSVNINSQKK